MNTMIYPRRKILLLLTGGTITMKEENGVFKPAHDIQDIIATFPRMKDIADISAHQICDIDSSNMSPRLWKDIAQTIEKNYQQYDGFVITHGTDTLAYTASALSFALRNLHKPVILTGAQKPISELGSDSPFNIFNSFQVAVHQKVKEVAIVFDTKIIRGNRSAKRSAKKIDAFWSPQFPLLGEIGIDIKYLSSIVHRQEANQTLDIQSGQTLELQANFDPNIISISLVPGFIPTILEQIIQQRMYRGIILHGFGAGNIPTDETVVPWIEKATQAGIPVILISPCPSGTTYLELYETGRRALDAGVISAKDMTQEATAVKLMWVLAQTNDMSCIRKLMQTNIAGEISESLLK